MPGSKSGVPIGVAPSIVRVSEGTNMHALRNVSTLLDKLLSVLGRLGAWLGLMLVIAVCTDVGTRYFGLPKPFGWNSTQLQESEYWLHTYLFSLMIGWAYTRDAHVRIDLVRELMSRKLKHVVELVGTSLFLFPFAVLGTWYTSKYAYASFIESETSKSALGLSHVWILKSGIVLMFVLMAFAAISEFFKSLAGLLERRPDNKIHSTSEVNH
jgi:TRAP-type mannitol/chloroaromatic compound transport system permease small subunit